MHSIRNHHMSAAYARLALLLSKPSRGGQSHSHGSLPPIAFLRGISLVSMKSLDSSDFLHWLGIVIPLHAASMTQANRSYFCSIWAPRSGKSQIPSQRAGSWNGTAPTAEVFLAKCLVRNLTGVSKRMCGYKPLVWVCDYDSTFGQDHLQIAY